MEKYEHYAFTEFSSHELIYEFTSLGSKGLIKKMVQFQKTADMNVYNLAFGNKEEDGTLDDQTTNNNQDRNKILATVAAIVFEFTERRQESFIYFSGSTRSRTRLYRIAISINYKDLADAFIIWGSHEEEGYEMFDPARTYQGFLIKRK